MKVDYKVIMFVTVENDVIDNDDDVTDVVQDCMAGVESNILRVVGIEAEKE